MLPGPHACAQVYPSPQVSYCLFSIDGSPTSALKETRRRSIPARTPDAQRNEMVRKLYMAFVSLATVLPSIELLEKIAITLEYDATRTGLLPVRIGDEAAFVHVHSSLASGTGELPSPEFAFGQG